MKKYEDESVLSLIAALVIVVITYIISLYMSQFGWNNIICKIFTMCPQLTLFQVFACRVCLAAAIQLPPNKNQDHDYSELAYSIAKLLTTLALFLVLYLVSIHL